MKRPSALLRLGLWLGILVLFLQASAGLAAPLGQEATPNPQAAALLEDMTPEERVGQLFLVTFTGADVSPESQIYDLVANGHVGGVVLQAGGNNFVAAPNTLPAVWDMIRDLQMADWQGAQEDRTDPATGETFRPNFIPLFIGISQEGDGYPYDQILSGLTSLPNGMALGATWQPDLAGQVGQVLGQELSALGFNLLLGPSLDVLSDPKVGGSGDIGTRSFGGDPYWVSQMGRAYVAGVHEGSQHQILVVATHFPGLGGADRPLEEEIPTVRKSLEQLTQIELAPFFAVTGDAPSQDMTVDGLLVSPIYYQGFQGNIRDTTRPIIFDTQAFGELMALDEFAAWRAAGGLTISDKLGTRAVRIFVDPSEQTFEARLVARDAFLAGNDLLYLSNFKNASDPDSYTTILGTLAFFAQKYREDVAFAQRVDEAVMRILTKKFALYSDFDLSNVLATQADLEGVQPNEQITFQVSRQAATLLNPAPEDLDSVIPQPPGLSSRIVFFTDTYTGSQCSECPQREQIAVNALEQAVVRLYGPGAAGLVQQGNLSSYSFSELQQFLETGVEPENMLARINSAQWLVFGLLDMQAGRPGSLALRNFLAARPDLYQGKQLVVFAFNVPYLLDATEISKIAAYYGLYSKQASFVEVAARLLFKEVAALGASPVSVPGLGYTMIEVTSPDPTQVIPLYFNVNEAATDIVTATPEVEGPPEVQVGDRLFLRTGTILDQNRHRVPDDTPVRFILTSTIEGVTQQRESLANTFNGVAQTNFLMESSGIIELHVESGQPIPAESAPLQIEVAPVDGLPVLPTPVEPTATPSPSPEPTQGAVVEPEPPPKSSTSVVDWALIVLVSGFVSLFAYQVGATAGLVRWGIRWALAALIGGLAANTYMAFQLPGSAWLVQSWGVWGNAVIAVIGAGLGWGLGFLWHNASKGE